MARNGHSICMDISIVQTKPSKDGSYYYISKDLVQEINTYLNAHKETALLERSFTKEQNARA